MELAIWFCFLMASCFGQDVNLLGDAYIVGLYEGHTADNGACGNVDVPSIMAMEATRWTIDQINKAQILPLTIGFRGYRTCGNIHTAGDIANTIVYDAKTAEYPIIGVLGPKYSSETKVVSRILNNQLPENRLLQLGFSATAVTLNDKREFPNFFRVLPDDDIQVKTMVQLMVDLQWNRIAIIYENDTYGQGAATNLRMEANRQHICIAQFVAIAIDESRGVSGDQIMSILDDLVLATTKIGAVVFLGNWNVANRVLFVTDQQAFRDVPLFLLPETVQLQMNVFRRVDGSNMKKARGSLFTSVPYDEIGGFKAYWRSLFADKDAVKNASMANPFLKEVFRKYSNCEIDDDACEAPSPSELNMLEKFQPTYVRYATMAVHVMAKTLRKVYASICPNSCNDDIKAFLGRFNPDRMIQAIDGLKVSFPEDYVPEIDSAGLPMTLNFTSDSTNPEYGTGNVLYEVYNFWEYLNQTTAFTKIGDVKDGELSLNKTLIVDYNENDDLQYYPDVRKGQCEPGRICTDCMDNEVSQAVYHIPGDVYVIGICSINNAAIDGPQGCGTIRERHGFQMVLAMKFGLETFMNSSTYKAYKDMFGETTVGLLVLNSCNSALEIDRKIVNLHRTGVVLDDGSILDLTDRVLGYIGGQAADVSEMAAEQLTRLGVVQMSYSSTYPRLSDKSLFPNFMRIVTPDDVQATVMMEIVLELGGKYIQLVYSKGKYGEGGRNNVVEAAKKNGICVAQMIEVAEDIEYFKYYELMRRETHAKLVIIFLRSHVVGDFMRDINSKMRPGEFQFIGSEAWARNAEVLEYDINKGSITVALEMAKNDDLDQYIKSQRPSWGITHPWLENYLQHRHDCYFPWSYNKKFSKICSESVLQTWDLNFESDPWCIFVTNTMLAFLKGSSMFYKKSCGTGLGSKLCFGYTSDATGLVEEMKQVRLDIGGSEEILIFDDNGDGKMGYKIFNIRLTDDSSVRDYIQVGSYDVIKGLTFDTTRVRYPTNDVIVSSCPSEKACEPCNEQTFGTQEPQADGDEGINAGTIVLGVLLGVSFLFITMLLGILYRRRKPKDDEDDGYITAVERETADGASQPIPESGFTMQHYKDIGKP